MVGPHGIPRPALLVLTVAALLLAGCSGPSGDGVEGDRPTVQGPVVVVSTLDPAHAEPLWKHLKRRIKRLDLTVETVADAELFPRVAAGGVDLILSGRTGPIESLTDAGLLAPLPEAITFGLPDARIGVRQRWIAIGLRARVIVVKRILANKPRYVTDLSEARFRGRVARSSEDGDGFQTTLATLMADRAESIAPVFLRGLDDNCGPAVFPADAETIAALAGGAAEIALVDHTAFYRHALGDAAGGPLADRKVAEAALEAIFPDSDGTGAAWSATGAGVATTAPHPDDAHVVLEVLLSAETQRVWSDLSLEYPAVEGVSAAAGLPAASQIVWSQTTLDELASLRSGALKHIEDWRNPPVRMADPLSDNPPDHTEDK